MVVLIPSKGPIKIKKVRQVLRELFSFSLLNLVSFILYFSIPNNLNIVLELLNT